MTNPQEMMIFNSILFIARCIVDWIILKHYMLPIYRRLVKVIRILDKNDSVEDKDYTELVTKQTEV